MAHQRVAQRGYGRKIVQWYVKEPLYLGRVEIHGDEVIDPDSFKHVGSHARGNWFSLAVSLILSRIAKVGNDGSDTGSGRPSTGVGEGQQFHQVLVYWWRRRLDYEHVASSHWFVDSNPCLAIGKTLDRAATEPHP
jgi:hypothetical protein